MNEDRKKRGLAHSKLLTAVAIGALFLGQRKCDWLTQVASDHALSEVTEQLQTHQRLHGLVVDAQR